MRKMKLWITAVMLCTAIMCQGMSVNAQEGVLPGARSYTDEKGNVLLGGNYMELGLAKEGSFGTTEVVKKDAGFHPNKSNLLGLVIDGDGFDVGNAPTTGDFFIPGTPEERYIVAYKKDGVPVNNCAATLNGAKWELPIKAHVTEDKSDIEKGILKAVTTGITKDNLQMQSEVSFHKDDKFFRVDITLKNLSTDTLEDVRYVRSIDLDQDVDLNGTFNTYNKVICNPNSESKEELQSAMAVSLGYKSLESFFFVSFDKRARASRGVSFSPNSAYLSGLWTDDSEKPVWADKDAIILTREMLNKSNYNGYKSEDNAIAMTFDCGDLKPEESASFTYYSSMNPDILAGYDEIFMDESGVDCSKEMLVDLTKDAVYIITVLDEKGNKTDTTYTLTADADGCISLIGDDYDLTGQYLEIKEVKEDSESAYLTIPGRQEKPKLELNFDEDYSSPDKLPTESLTVSENSAFIQLDINQTDEMKPEYSIDRGENWISPDENGVLEFAGLEQGKEYTVQARIPATKYQLASEVADVVTFTTHPMLDVTTPKQSTIRYDGRKHDFSVSVNPADAKTQYSFSVNAAYSDNLPVFKEAGKYIIYYKISKEGYRTVYGSFAAEIEEYEHVHNWWVHADGSKIIAECKTDGECCFDFNPELVLTAPEKTTYGDGKSEKAVLTGLEDFNECVGKTVSENDIYYEGRETTAYDRSTTAPVNAGKYTAELTVGEAKATVNYEIAKADPDYETPDVIYAEFGQNLSELTLPTADNGTWSWKDEKQNVGETGEKTFYAEFTPADKDNYNTVENVPVKVIVAMKPHVHVWKLQADGAKITAVCKADDPCMLDSNPELILTAPEKTTYGDGKSEKAALSGLKAFNEYIEGTVSENDIYYEGRETTAYDRSTTAPVNAGKYTAELTVGEAKATVNYEIAKADPDYETPDVILAEFGQKLSELTLPTADNGTWSWKDKDLSFEESGEKTVYAVFVPTDANNYKVVDNISVIISVKEMTKPNPDGEDDKPTVSGNGDDQQQKNEEESGQKTVTAPETSPANITKPVRPVIKSAKNKKAKSVTVKLKKGEADGYEVICVSNKKKLSKVKKGKNFSKNTFILKKLKPGKTYYIKVRAFKKNANGEKVYSKWSKVKSIKVKK